MTGRPPVALIIQPSWREAILGAETETALGSFAEIIDMPGVRLTEKHLPRLLADAEACLTSWETPPLSKAALDAAPHLKLIAHAAGTIKRLVPEDAFSRGIRVSQATHHLATALAEHVVAQALLCLQRLHRDDLLVRGGNWIDVAHRKRRRLLGARHVGIWGMGRAGRAAAALFAGFGCSISYYDPVADTGGEPPGTRVSSLEALFGSADLLVLLAPLLPETAGAVDGAMLSRLPDGAVLINAGRSRLADEAALIAELQSGRIVAAVDVFDSEPPPANHPLFGLDNVVLSPHVGGHTAETHRRQGRDMVDEARRFFAGEPLRFEVSPAALGRLA
jgi:phosphoglycerate dehydrogenase-like enzyme